MPYFGTLQYGYQMPGIGKGSWLDGPSRPGPTKDDLSILRDGRIKPAKKPLRVEEPVAAKMVLEALDRSSYKRNHVVAFDSRTQYLYNARELPWQVFDELDRELFLGMLKGNVYLAWSDLPRDYPGMTTRPGENSSGLRGPRITIELAEGLLKHGTSAHILAILLHQMIHAYFLQCCGHRNKAASGIGCDLTHHHGFSAVLYAIQDRFLKGNLPSLWGQPRKKHSHPLFTPGIAAPGSSDCYVNKQRLSKGQCEDYVTHALAGVTTSQPQTAGSRILPNAGHIFLTPITQYLHLIDPESSPPRPCHRRDYLHPKSTYLELHFLSRAFPISKHLIHHIPSLHRASSSISIPPTTSDASFRALYSFLHRGDYPPNLPPTPTGPPIILPAQPANPPLLLTHIRTYRLARALSIPTLATHALHRLAREANTHNDPIAVLDEIYHPPHGTPEPDLRTWVQKWLRVPIPAAQGEYARLYATNLAVCKGEAWRDGWARLRERGGVVIADLDAVERETEKMEKAEKEKAQKEDKAEKEKAAMVPPRQRGYDNLRLIPGVGWVPVVIPTPQHPPPLRGIGSHYPPPLVPGYNPFARGFYLGGRKGWGEPTWGRGRF